MSDARYILQENEYCMEKEKHNATLFATGNGYMGCRGSFEEYSTLGVQGLYVRGILDEIIEISTPVPTDYYMKKYYFNEDRLKDFEKTECGINLVDVLTVRIWIGGELFQMHEGTLLSYHRSIDFRTGVLTRKLRWQNAAGDVTDITFERFASYENEHLYCQRITVTPIQHSKEIVICSGMDLRTKTNGQKVTKVLSKEKAGTTVSATIQSGSKYGFLCAVKIANKMQGSYTCVENDLEDIHCVQFVGTGKAVLEKTTFLGTSRDKEEPLETWFDLEWNKISKSYQENYTQHRKTYQKAFALGNVEIEGDDDMAKAVAFSCWHTLISACKKDSVHGLSAKGLTGEQYHQYVWWDSEIYQMPYFIYTSPQTAKNLLMYRYNTLQQARINAQMAGKEGARFAFCSGITGEECVWSFCNHPFMQDHIAADVAFSVLHYDSVTGDTEFMENYGYEIVFACLQYWVSRATKTERGWEILRVTGTDEHHPFVNNDAYTNYLVHYVADKAIEIVEKEKDKFDFSKVGVDDAWMQQLIGLRDGIYLPVEDGGLIPQFDGYFSLSSASEETNYAHGTQMKHKGYHKSQFIKQPDVVLLYTYTNIGMDDKYYARNFDYYEKMCECSSSLSYAPHAIACADNDRLLSFYEYLKRTSYIDIKNLHGGSEEGVHSGCAAGAWYSIFRGLFGCVCTSDKIILNPKRLPWWKKTSISFFYKNCLIKMTIRDKILTIEKKGRKSLTLLINKKEYLLKGKLQVIVE